MNDNYFWYLSRSSALVAFLLLYISIFFGLAIRTSILKKIIKPIYSFNLHCLLSFQALLFATLHGIILIFHKFINFNWKNVFIPFYPTNSSLIDKNFLALGVISFYLIIILVFSSYLRRFISNWFWRFIHSFNIILYIFVVIHALYLGTDLKIPLWRNIFLALNGFLALLFVANLTTRLLEKVKSFNNKQL